MRPSTAATNKSGPEQSTTVRESHKEVRRNASPFRQSAAGETDTKIRKSSESTEENSTGVGCEEDCSYPTDNANGPIHPKSAKTCEKRYANALSTGNEQTCVDVSFDQNTNEFYEENPHSSETSSKKPEQKKSFIVSGTKRIFTSIVSSLLPK